MINGGQIMSNGKFTVRELASYLLGLIENGHGDKTVKLSVNYDHCDHIQDLKSIHYFDSIDWITLDGNDVE